MADIVTLADIRAEPDADALEYARNLLARIESGEIRAFGIVTVKTRADQGLFTGTGVAGTDWASHADALLAGTHFLQDRIKREGYYSVATDPPADNG